MNEYYITTPVVGIYMEVGVNHQTGVEGGEADPETEDGGVGLEIERRETKNKRISSKAAYQRG